MCGRYATARDPADLVEEFGVDRYVVREGLAPDFALPGLYQNVEGLTRKSESD